jgi:hypothetical protein
MEGQRSDLQLLLWFSSDTEEASSAYITSHIPPNDIRQKIPAANIAKEAEKEPPEEAVLAGHRTSTDAAHIQSTNHLADSAPIECLDWKRNNAVIATNKEPSIKLMIVSGN